tara:strand:- start:2243 stop:3172 length:930 start_codon:yes stop_codon:yes gene_type:complete
MSNKIKVYLNKAGESWVVDRFRDEWLKYNDNKSLFLRNSDLVWIIAPWRWSNLNKDILGSKKVVCTIHHIDIEKFNNDEVKEFYLRDNFVDEYHVPSKKTYIQLKEFTDKQINSIPFWIDSKKYFSIDDKEAIRDKYSVSNEAFVIGSFQRDTEGQDLISPKLSKGPDKLLEFLKIFNKEKKNLLVLLSGYRRQYLMKELEKNEIDFKYIEKPSIKVLNELYNILDLYIVASRVEGGPQSIMECGLIKVPIISTDVGVASEILDSKSIIKEDILEAVPNINLAHENSLKYQIPSGLVKFNTMFKRINEN